LGLNLPKASRRRCNWRDIFIPGGIVPVPKRYESKKC